MALCQLTVALAKDLLSPFYLSKTVRMGFTGALFYLFFFLTYICKFPGVCLLKTNKQKKRLRFMPHISPSDIKMFHVEFFPSISSGEVLACQPGKLYAILFAKLL